MYLGEKLGVPLMALYLGNWNVNGAGIRDTQSAMIVGTCVLWITLRPKFCDVRKV